MRTTLVFLALAVASGGVAAADTLYEKMIKEAVALQTEKRRGESPERRFGRAYDHLAKAAQRRPERWEAFFYRGLNRCEMAVVTHGVVQETLTKAHAAGASPEKLKEIEGHGRDFLEMIRQEARQNFEVMVRRMQESREYDKRNVDLAKAALRYANRQYLDDGKTKGSISLFRSLAERRVLPATSWEYVARSYNELGVQEYTGENFPEAQDYWDKALRAAERAEKEFRAMGRPGASVMREVIMTNKAGAYEMDQEFGRAETILRRQVEVESFNAAHCKNLGLVLGFQNKLDEALYYYERARRICRSAGDGVELSRWHGNAWLRAASIHGVLLERNGDVELAWRLFLEYRALFGDDYNFSFWFGSFAAALGNYELAWTYLQRASELQPHCPAPFQKLLEIAPRTAGSTDEVRERIAKAKEAFAEVRRNYRVRGGSPTLKRICGGLQDLGDAAGAPPDFSLLEPDPLAGLGPAAPPDWVRKEKERREPYEPWEPKPDEAPPPVAVPDGPAPDEDGFAGTWRRLFAWGLGALVLVGLGILVLARRGGPEAAAS